MGKRRGGTYKSIKWPRVYEALKRKFHNKTKAARISNAMFNKRHGRGAKNIG